MKVKYFEFTLSDGCDYRIGTDEIIQDIINFRVKREFTHGYYHHPATELHEFVHKVRAKIEKKTTKELFDWMVELMDWNDLHEHVKRSVNIDNKVPNEVKALKFDDVKLIRSKK